VNVCPSTSVTRAPDAAAWYTGNPPGHIRIQVIGTPPSRCPPAASNAARDRGKPETYAPRSRSISPGTGGGASPSGHAPATWA
jgi:hypothetical protein